MPKREGKRIGCLLTCLLLMMLAVSACSSSNSQAVFNSETGQHPANWVQPLAIGSIDFHATLAKEVQSAERGPVLFSLRCAICHEHDGGGKIGPPIRGADATAIAAAIAVVPLMKGQAGLSPADIQEIAAYLATLTGGAEPVATVTRTDGCMECHGSALTGGIARISCFSCHEGPHGDIGHPAGWGFDKTDSVNFHGSYGRKFSQACTTCHGANLAGGIGRPCAFCHNGNVAPALNFIPPPGQPGSQAVTIITTLSGAQEAPAVVTPGTGTATLTIDLNTGAVSGSVTFTGLTANATLAHIHTGATGVNGPPIITLTGGAGATAGTWTVPAGSALTAGQLVALRADGLYVNIHTETNPGGEIRGQILFSGLVPVATVLSGAQEAPPVTTPGNGTALFFVDLNSGAVSGSVSFTGLTTNALAAHIHEGAAGVNGPVIVPLEGGAGATAGTWRVPVGSILTTAQLDALKTGGLYVNIHTATNPGGEIRGQLSVAGRITLTTSLGGAQEAPAVVTPGSGTATLTVSLATGSISGSVSFTGLTSNAVAAHIHTGAVGVNGPPIVTLEGGAGATAGTWSVPAGTFLTAAQIDALTANGLYINIHTAANPDGEIRGQINFAGLITLNTSLSGDQESPAVVTPGSGTATLTVDLNTGAVSGSVSFTGLTSNALAAHIHEGAAGFNGPPIVVLEGGAGVTAGTWTVPAGSILTAAQLEALKTDGLYVNIHTATNPDGEIRGQINFAYRFVTLNVALSGAQEVPPVATAGSGTALLTIDVVTGAVSGSVSFSGLGSLASAAHIHQGAAGVNGPVILPLVGGAGATAGTWTAPAGSVLTAAQLTALRANGLYVNIHTAANLGGEIRGQIIFPAP